MSGDDFNKICEPCYWGRTTPPELSKIVSCGSEHWLISQLVQCYASIPIYLKREDALVSLKSLWLDYMFREDDQTVGG